MSALIVLYKRNQPEKEVIQKFTIYDKETSRHVIDTVLHPPSHSLTKIQIKYEKMPKALENVDSYEPFGNVP